MATICGSTVVADCCVCSRCAVYGVVYGAVVPKSRSDGGRDGSTMVDGTSVDVVGGGASLCCC